MGKKVVDGAVTGFTEGSIDGFVVGLAENNIMGAVGVELG